MYNPLSISNKQKNMNEYKDKVCAESYIGVKGYTIPKSILTPTELEFLKKDLFLKPQIPGPSFGPTLNDAFPVYRENDKKYIFRDFMVSKGMEHPKEVKLHLVWISIYHFQKNLGTIKTI